MLSLSVPTEHYFANVDSTINSIIVEVAGSMQTTMPNPSLRFMVFEATSDSIFQAIRDAYKRGIDVGGLIDYRQSQGSTQRQKLTELWQDVPREKFILGTSTQNQIIHTKMIWIGWSETATTIVPEDWTRDHDWRDAVRNGIPVTVVGSENFTDVAQRQCNTLHVIPGQQYAAACQHLYDITKSYNVQHHASWQTDPIPLNPQVFPIQ